MRCWHLFAATALLVLVATPSNAQSSGSAVNYTNRGIVRFAAGDLNGAIADLDIAVAFDPSYAVAFYNRGRARHDLHNLGGAIADYTRAIELNPRLAQAY